MKGSFKLYIIIALAVSLLIALSFLFRDEHVHHGDCCGLPIPQTTASVISCES